MKIFLSMFAANWSTVWGAATHSPCRQRGPSSCPTHLLPRAQCWLWIRRRCRLWWSDKTLWGA